MRVIEYGIPSDKEAIQLRLGIARGFFRAEGLHLSLKVIFGGPEIAAAYDSGALKVGELGSPPATTALSKGARFGIVAESRGRPPSPSAIPDALCRMSALPDRRTSISRCSRTSNRWSD